MELTTLSNKKETLDYPCLKQFKDGDFVVLFTEPSMGFVVKSNYEPYEIWHHSKGWYETDFHEFNGEVSLSN